ncbi:heme-dependent oxidative N-demethylase subunit alpha family protein, partial [Pseudophaeobacter sp.]|uniref:heme-dependent oxidative N-demethylase subunit alpha family protein n=1 Tax=Pseudophaeobacter sp. TaxID=1971739 RepID=UPI0032991684
RPLWRFNALWYQSPELFAPRSVNDRRDTSHGTDAPYMRSEQQVILRLPKSRAVVFSIHTYMVHRDDVMAQWGNPAWAES